MKCNGPDSCRYRTADGRCIDNNECHHGVPDAPAAPRAIGQHWLEVALERVRAGETEATVMRDYGWRR